MKLKKFEVKNKSDLIMKSLGNKNPYEIGKISEKKAINHLKEYGFKNINWVSNKKPTSHYDITAKKNNKFFYIEVRYTKSKKFQITKKKLDELKKLSNVLFLFISPEKIRLIPLEKMENEDYIFINKGFINNLEIKKRKIEGDKKSLLIQFINSPKMKIVDFLVDNKPLDFSKEEIARGVGLSKTSIHKHWNELEKQGIVKITRRFGKTKLYTLDTKSMITKKILELERALISNALEKEVKSKKELLVSA